MHTKDGATRLALKCLSLSPLVRLRLVPLRFCATRQRAERINVCRLLRRKLMEVIRLFRHRKILNKSYVKRLKNLLFMARWLLQLALRLSHLNRLLALTLRLITYCVLPKALESKVAVRRRLLLRAPLILRLCRQLLLLQIAPAVSYRLLLALQARSQAYPLRYLVTRRARRVQPLPLLLLLT